MLATVDIGHMHHAPIPLDHDESAGSVTYTATAYCTHCWDRSALLPLNTLQVEWSTGRERRHVYTTLVCRSRSSGCGGGKAYNPRFSGQWSGQVHEGGEPLAPEPEAVAVSRVKEHTLQW